MAFFPKSTMPNVRKKNAGSIVGSILAESFNLHTDEIIAMEEFLGTSGASEADINALLSGRVDPANMIGILKLLADAANLISDGGVLSTSGYVHNGQRMIFPDGATTTFLQAPPAATDKTIKVSSTIGFPDSGIISILNDIDVPSVTGSDQTPVEIIQYNGKTSTQFLNCERGVDKTTVGSHSGGFIETGIASPGSTNMIDQCLTLPIAIKICNRRYPGLRLKTFLFFPAFGLLGSFVEIVRKIRRDPLAFELSETKLGGSYDNVIDAATQAGILVTASDGSYILQSADSAKLALNELTWIEASVFAGALQTSGDIVVLNQPSDYRVGVAPFIPVFQGRMAVQHSLAALTLNPTAASVPAPPATVTTVTTPAPTTTSTTPNTGAGVLTQVSFFTSRADFDNQSAQGFRIIQASYRGREFNVSAANGTIAIARIDGSNLGDIGTQSFIFNRRSPAGLVIGTSISYPIDKANFFILNNTDSLRWVILTNPDSSTLGNGILAGDSVIVTLVNNFGTSNILTVATTRQILTSASLGATLTVSLPQPPPAPATNPNLTSISIFTQPDGLQSDPVHGNMIWFNGGYKTYQLNLDSRVLTHVAGNGQLCCAIGFNALATLSTTNSPWINPIYSTGGYTLHLAIPNMNRTGVVSTALQLSLLAGSGLAGAVVDNNTAGVSASLNNPMSLATYDAGGFVADTNNNRFLYVRQKTDLSGYLVTPVRFMTFLDSEGVPDFSFNKASFYPTQMRNSFIGPTQNSGHRTGFFVVSNNRIWIVTPSIAAFGDTVESVSVIMNVFAGTGVAGNSGDGGPARLAQITPKYYCYDKIENIYVTDGFTIRKIDHFGVISTLAITLHQPDDIISSMCIDSLGNIYYSESSKNKIVKIAFPYGSAPATVIIQEPPAEVVVAVVPPAVPSTTTTPTLPATVPLTPATTPPTYLSSIGIAQTADGRLYVKLTSDQEQDEADQAVIEYKTFFTPSFRTSQQKDAF